MMLEADVLCSRIAIVARGALKVIGSQQHLKVSNCAARIVYSTDSSHALSNIVECRITTARDIFFR